MLTSTIPAALLSIAAVTGQPRGEVLDFTATWCGPCQQMAPVVSKLERAGYPIRTVDVDNNRALAKQFGISSIPAFVLVVDGREVTRLVGSVSEQQLLNMMSQIPSDPPVMLADKESRSLGRSTEPAASSWSAAPDAAPASRTPSRELTQPVAAITEEPPRHRSPLADNDGTAEKSPGLFGKLFGRNKQPAPQTPEVVRANLDNETAEPANVLPVRNPAGASMRLYVTINGQTQMGSGTAIDSRTGHTLVLTCGHLFDGWNDRSKIEVDLFNGEKPQRFVGRMIHFDPVADVGVVAIPTDEIVATAAVAPAAARPQVGDPLVSIGCSGGATPSQEQIQVIDLNYYEGPDNILCTGVPVQGRSGGGLFNREGQLVGVCIAADAERQRGAYAGVLAIHDLLTAAGLADLFQPAAPTSASPQPNQFANSNTASPAGAATPSVGTGTSASPSSLTPTSQVTQPTTPPSQTPEQTAAATAPKSDFDPFASPAGGGGGDMEVICIIRSRQQPDAPSRVVIIDRPSSRFLSYLDGEVAARETPVRANHVPPVTAGPSTSPSSDRYSAAPSDGYPATSTRFSDPTQPDAAPSTAAPGERSRAASLQPTALAQPFRPRRYVRSSQSRSEK